jgi:hypothetical protein
MSRALFFLLSCVTSLQLSFSLLSSPCAALPMRRQQSFRLAAEAGQEQAQRRQRWPVGRFFKTLSFFNAPKILDRPSMSPRVSGSTVLVTGAETEIGREVVSLLSRRGGLKVRAFTRDKKTASELLRAFEGLSGVQVADPYLDTGLFSSVSSVIVCDGTASKETVAQALSKFQDHGSVGGPVIFGSEPTQLEAWSRWGALDDVVMGGVSLSEMKVSREKGKEGRPAAVFSGEVRTENSGGFSSTRCKNFTPPLDLAAYLGLQLTLKGDGQRYKLCIYDTAGWDAATWCYSFDTVENEWMDLSVPWGDLRAIRRAQTMKDPPPFHPESIYSFQIMLSKFEYDGELSPNFRAGPFELVIDSIRAIAPSSRPDVVLTGPSSGVAIGAKEEGRLRVARVETEAKVAASAAVKALLG